MHLRSTMMLSLYFLNYYVIDPFNYAHLRTHIHERRTSGSRLLPPMIHHNYTPAARRPTLLFPPNTRVFLLKHSVNTFRYDATSVAWTSFITFMERHRQSSKTLFESALTTGTKSRIGESATKVPKKLVQNYRNGQLQRPRAACTQKPIKYHWPFRRKFLEMDHYFHMAALPDLPTKDHTTMSLSRPHITGIFHHHVAMLSSEIQLSSLTVTRPILTQPRHLGRLNHAALISDSIKFSLDAPTWEIHNHFAALLDKYTSCSVFCTGSSVSY